MPERPGYSLSSRSRSARIARIATATIFAAAVATTGMYTVGGTPWGSDTPTAHAQEIAMRRATTRTTTQISVDSALQLRGRTRTTTTTTPAPSTTTTTRAPATTTTTRPAVTTTTTTAPVAGPQQGAQLTAGDVVYSGGIGNAHFELFSMHPDGSGVKQLTTDTRYNSWWPRPSPDRTRVLFYRTPATVAPFAYDQAALWMMNADGTDPHVVFAQGANGWTFQAHANWSPDGARIVFTAATTQALIMTVAPDGSGLKTLGGGPGANVDPSYSFDGRTIVYVGCPTWTCTPETSEVFTMPADGSGSRTQLTHDGIRDQDPAIAPDGRTVAFLSQTVAPSASSPYGEWQLRTVGIDGSSPRQITSGSALESAPRWSADGTRLWTHRTAFDATVWDVTSMRPDGSDLVPIPMPWSQESPAVA